MTAKNMPALPFSSIQNNPMPLHCYLRHTRTMVNCNVRELAPPIRVVAFAQPAIPFRSGLVKMVEETGTWIVLQKRGLLIKTPCKHKYRVLNRSMTDVLEVMGAWLALNGDDYSIEWLAP